MAVDVRVSGRRVKVYRAGAARRASDGSPLLGSLPVHGAVPRAIASAIGTGDIEKIEAVAKAAAIRLAPAVVAEVVEGCAHLASVGGHLSDADRARLRSAAAVLLSALEASAPTDATAAAGIASDAPPAVPPGLEPPAPAASSGADIYSVDDGGRLVARSAPAETDAAGRPLPSQRFRAMAAARYPGVDIDGLVAAWHADLASGAARRSGSIQSAADQDFLFHVPRIVRRRLRAELPDLRDRDAFDRLAEGLAWESSLDVDGARLRRYAVALDATNERTVWQPKSHTLVEDLRAWIGAPEARPPQVDAVADPTGHGTVTRADAKDG